MKNLVKEDQRMMKHFQRNIYKSKPFDQGQYEAECFTNETIYLYSANKARRDKKRLQQYGKKTYLGKA